MPYRLDRSQIVVGVMIFVRIESPSKLITKVYFRSDIKGFFLELTFSKSKWLSFGTYCQPVKSHHYILVMLIKLLICTYVHNSFLAGKFNSKQDSLT